MSHYTKVAFKCRK